MLINQCTYFLYGYNNRTKTFLFQYSLNTPQPHKNPLFADTLTTSEGHIEDERVRQMQTPHSEMSIHFFLSLMWYKCGQGGGNNSMTTMHNNAPQSKHQKIPHSLKHSHRQPNLNQSHKGTRLRHVNTKLWSEAPHDANCVT